MDKDLGDINCITGDINCIEGGINCNRLLCGLSAYLGVLFQRDVGLEAG